MFMLKLWAETTRAEVLVSSPISLLTNFERKGPRPFASSVVTKSFLKKTQ